LEESDVMRKRIAADPSGSPMPRADLTHEPLKPGDGDKLSGRRHPPTLPAFRGEIDPLMPVAAR